MKILNSMACSAAVFLVIGLLANWAIQASGGSVEFKATGLALPQKKPVYYGLLMGADRFEEIEAKGYWYGGDVVWDVNHQWVLVVYLPMFAGKD